MGDVAAADRIGYLRESRPSRANLVQPAEFGGHDLQRAGHVAQRLRRAVRGHSGGDPGQTVGAAVDSASRACEPGGSSRTILSTACPNCPGPGSASCSNAMSTRYVSASVRPAYVGRKAPIARFAVHDPGRAGILGYRLGLLPEQPVRTGQRRALLPSQPDQIGSSLLLRRPLDSFLSLALRPSWSTRRRGLTTGEIAAHFATAYGATVSEDTISRIIDKVRDDTTEWQHRPLNRGRFQ